MAQAARRKKRSPPGVDTTNEVADGLDVMLAAHELVALAVVGQDEGPLGGVARIP